MRGNTRQFKATHPTSPSMVVCKCSSAKMALNWKFKLSKITPGMLGRGSIGEGILNPKP